MLGIACPEEELSRLREDCRNGESCTVSEVWRAEVTFIPGSAAARAIPAAKPAANAAEMVSGCVGNVDTPPAGADSDAERISQAVVLSVTIAVSVVSAQLVSLAGDVGRERGVGRERSCCRCGVC